jgi:hypothetical protein
MYVEQDGPAGLHDAYVRAFESPGIIAKGGFLAVLVEVLLAWKDWDQAQRTRILNVLLPQLSAMRHDAEVALLGDWISEGVPIPTAKEWMIRLIRQRPDFLGDVLFSMRSRLFKRFEAEERERAMELHRRLYADDVNDPEVFAREHEKLWGLRR